MASYQDYLLHLADNALILGQRNAEWCGHGPILEEDLALANNSLDLIGQARLLYQHVATVRKTARAAKTCWPTSATCRSSRTTRCWNCHTAPPSCDIARRPRLCRHDCAQLFVTAR